MVDRGPAARAVFLEQGGVHHPQERPLAGIDQAQALADLQPGRAQQLPGLARGAGGEEDAVTRRRSGGIGKPCPFGVRQVPRDRPRLRYRPVGADNHVSEAAGAAGARPLLPAVQFPA